MRLGERGCGFGGRFGTRGGFRRIDRTGRLFGGDHRRQAQFRLRLGLALGAGGLATFWRVTAPNVRWGLLYGVLLCNARAMGEFGAVSVVSGHIRGRTDTLPLHVEILYNEYDFTGAFAVAALLCLLAVATLVLKTLLELARPEEAAHGR